MEAARRSTHPWLTPSAAIVARLTRERAAADAARGANDPPNLIVSTQTAFVRAAAAREPPLAQSGVLVREGRRLAPVDVLARACGRAAALPWRADPEEAATAIADDLDDLAIVADPTPVGAAVVRALRDLVADVSHRRRHVLLVNGDVDDFVYSFQFGRSVERRCVERDLRVDRIVINRSTRGDLAAELGHPVPPPIADGTETAIDSEHDSSLAAALRRLATRHHQVVVANVRPVLFWDLFAAGLFAAPTLLWDRHLHGGLRAEGVRRGVDPDALRGLPMTAWSLDKVTGSGLQRSLAEAGVPRGSGRIWALDLDFFRSTAAAHPGRVFAGGENQRDWPLLIEAVRDLPVEVHLVTGDAPGALPPNVRIDARLPLWRFRDAMASAAVAVVPLLPGAAAGVTIIPIAMALGVAVVATRTPWTEPLITDAEDGVLVPAGDARALRAALQRLHEQADWRARLAANARRRVATLCDLEGFTREMFATLD